MPPKPSSHSDTLSSLPTSPSSSPHKPLPRPSRKTATHGESASRPDYLGNWKEDLFGDGLPFYDLLVSIDAHIDLFKRQTLAPLRSGWEARAKPIADEWRARASAIEAKLKRNIAEDQLGSSSERAGRRAETERELDRELREFAERELREFAEKLRVRRERIQTRWNDSKTVSLREKMSFFLGVQNVLGTALLLAFWPEYIPLSYTLQAAYYLPLRVYTYRQQAYHYFLFDICYVINGLCLVFLWLWPSNVLLFEACYGLAHGPSAFAIATWRNSLVFHSSEKVTSLFIHIYPAVVFTVLRHFYPDPATRYPALAGLDAISLPRTLLLCSTIYVVWQTLYYQYVIVARAQKIATGGRPTSFTYLLNSKRGLVSKLLRSVRPDRRAKSFMIAQYVYTILTMVPMIKWGFYSRKLSGGFLWLMFSVSVWNGASFYMEVYGRRFEKELQGLKKELDQLNSSGSCGSVGGTVGGESDDGLAVVDQAVGENGAADGGSVERDKRDQGEEDRGKEE